MRAISATDVLTRAFYSGERISSTIAMFAGGRMETVDQLLVSALRARQAQFRKTLQSTQLKIARSIDPRPPRVQSDPCEDIVSTDDNIDLSELASTRKSFSLTDKDGARFLRIVSDAQEIERHYHLFLWLHGELQEFLPHQIMISAWGDLANWDLKLDIVSALPGARTKELAHSCISGFLKNAYARWIDGNRVPLVAKASESVAALGTRGGPIHDALGKMRSMLVHCVHDQRSGHDSLYVALNSGPVTKGRSGEQFKQLVESLFQQIDSAYRRVASLQLPPLAQGGAHGDWLDLSTREQEILDLICYGKTNTDIAAALEISPFTVKNHIQRIFKKIGVNNRTQAATRYSRALRELRSYLEQMPIER